MEENQGQGLPQRPPINTLRELASSYAQLPIDVDTALVVAQRAGARPEMTSAELRSVAAMNVTKVGDGWVRFGDVVAGVVLTWLSAAPADLPAPEMEPDPEGVEARVQQFLARVAEAPDEPPSWVIGRGLRCATLQLGELRGQHTRTLCVSGKGVLVLVTGLASPATLHGARAIVCDEEWPLSPVQQAALWGWTKLLCELITEADEPSERRLVVHWSDGSGDQP